MSGKKLRHGWLAPVGQELGFAAAEAYRLLRTNVVFALPDAQRCKVIGVTSAESGEGKSTTAMNLSYMLAEAGKRTILLEADLRLPTVAARLELNVSPGLSNMLVGMSSVRQILQDSKLEEKLKVITSGDIPPNPSELLTSEAMETGIEVFSQNADYIILDLPPINEVADAVAVSHLTDGMIVVVRQGYSTRGSVNAAMRQLRQVNAKVLGFVMTYSDVLKKERKAGGKYKNRYYRKYYKGYSYSYSYQHAHAKSAAALKAAGSSDDGQEKKEETVQAGSDGG